DLRVRGQHQRQRAGDDGRGERGAAAQGVGAVLHAVPVAAAAERLRDGADHVHAGGDEVHGTAEVRERRGGAVVEAVEAEQPAGGDGDDVRVERGIGDAAAAV